MGFSYNSTLPSDLDWVRFLSGDTDMTAPFLSDEELTAILNAETSSGVARRYFAAATALSALSSKWTAGDTTSGGTVVEKQVDDLRLRYGGGSSGVSVSDAVDKRIAWLRRQGAWLLSPRPRALRAV